MRILLCLFVLLLLSACSEMEFLGSFTKDAPPDSSAGNFKVGKPYSIDGTTYYPRETYSYEETGIASWYGPGFHGKSTASGERFNTRELTAAHRTLQMPSLVRVTNLDNGKSVIVRVNDRGPFSKGRIIDVSQKAAELLGMIGTGTAKVKVQLLADESFRLASAAKRGGALPQVPGHVSETGVFYPDPVVKQMPVVPSNIYVQLGAFRSMENAQALAARMSSIRAARVYEAAVNGQTIYRVRIGPIARVDEADKILWEVTSKGHRDALITVH
ncbi:MAG: septal ring lytic transglycosylase RlpA family protein [Alphaproteobacteria bacterium]|nr:septal ring lytic transglycosylase RlpA family protein [Alphaproteobacteria bacterium]